MMPIVEALGYVVLAYGVTDGCMLGIISILLLLLGGPFAVADPIGDCVMV